MFHIALLEPEIPPNTGNIMRTCAVTGAHLHLIEPLGFTLEDARLRRAGLDYREYATVRTHGNLDALTSALPEARLWAFSTRGQRPHTTVTYDAGDVLLFGPETRGLPTALLNRLPPEQVVRLPMLPDRRSLNLATAVAIALYEAWRQHEFRGATP